MNNSFINSRSRHPHRRNKGLKPLVIASVLLLSLILSACRPQSEPTVVTTIAMIGDIASSIAGDCIAVETIMGSGVDPHLYKASADDVRSFQNAGLILYAGLHLEGQLGEVFESVGQQRPVIAVSEAAVPAEQIIASEDEYGVDPHVWMDVSLWARTVDVINEQLASLNSNCADDMQNRANQFKTELTALHGWVAESIASIPEQQRILVTAHDAFEYYSSAYDIDVAGIQGISTESEAAIADIQDTVSLVLEREVPALFVESSINPRTIEAVLAAVRDQGFEASIGGELFSDAMGAADTAEGTYIGMMRHNTINITEALGGTVAEWPQALNGWATKWDIN